MTKGDLVIQLDAIRSRLRHQPYNGAASDASEAERIFLLIRELDPNFEVYKGYNKK